MKKQKNKLNINSTKSPLFTVFIKLIITFCIMISFLFGDNYFVNGLVKNKITNESIVGVNVQVNDDSIGTTTDKFGYFRLKIKKLPVKLKISHIGYKNKIIVVKKVQNLILLKPSVLTSEEILVTASRATEGKTPIAITQLNKGEINSKHSHQDLPMMLNDTPGTFSYSDAGNGVGYSYLKIRGFSQNRISILLNGIPLNDPESHSVYWVDHGDIASSVSDIQIQRGVANSLYGSAAFGGSVNLTTNYYKMEEGFTSIFGYGNYCDKNMLNLSSNKYSFHFVEKPENIKNFVVFGRYSNLSSNGYRKGSGTEQDSYQFALEKNSEKSRTQFEIIHGFEKTMFSWDGVIPYYGYDLSDRSDRRYNYYADPEYNSGFNDVNKDVFTQSIISLQHSHKIKNNGLMNITLYKVSGDGYYEQFKGNKSVVKYNLNELMADTSVEEVDLIRRKWLKNGYYGTVYHYSHNLNFGQITIGGDYRNYSADHFGKVLQAENINFISDDHCYYSDESKKISFSFYIHSIIEITDNLLTMVDLKYLGHRYEFDQEVIGAFSNGYEYKLKYDFFDPHFGIRYNFSNDLSIFGNISTAHREPSNGDIYDHDEPDMEPAVKNIENEYATSKVKEEFLIDSEFGVQYNKKNISASLNLFRMQFKNELVPVEYRYNEGSTEALHGNADKSIHQGLEFSLISKFGEHLKFNSNFSYSDNYFVEYFGDSLGWGGYGGIADYSNKTIPAYPAIQYNGKITYKYKIAKIWFDYSHVGKQYIDFNNTESASIKKYNLFNIGTRIEFENILGFETVIDFRINNLFDTLYETFGYNYYSDKNTRIDVYWPAAVRSYYLTIKIKI